MPDDKKKDDKKAESAESKSKTLLPHNKLADAAAASIHHTSKSVVATRDLEEAIEVCRKKVEKIAKECRMANRKYRDLHFDLKRDGRYCLDGLLPEHRSELNPEGTLRVAVGNQSDHPGESYLAN
jgi:hypothetical protein